MLTQLGESCISRAGSPARRRPRGRSNVLRSHGGFACATIATFRCSAVCCPSITCTSAAAARSRYVVLTWPWQVGVSLALAAVAVWAGLASFGWLAAHLETLDQRRELARGRRPTNGSKRWRRATPPRRRALRRPASGASARSSSRSKPADSATSACPTPPRPKPRTGGPRRLPTGGWPSGCCRPPCRSTRAAPDAIGSTTGSREIGSTSQRGPPRRSACATSCAPPGPRSPGSRTPCGTRRRGRTAERR